jgi:hypothetical protein
LAEHLDSAAYFLARARDVLDEYQPSRERSLVATKIEEAELWLGRCKPTAEAAERPTYE